MTLLADRWCPTSRTYCTYLAESGYKFKNIIIIDFISFSRKQKILKKVLPLNFLHTLVRKKRVDWPNYSPLSSYFDLIQKEVQYPIDYVSPFDFSLYGERIEEFVSEDYNTPEFQQLLLSRGEQTFLYTNGGIVPDSLLSAPQIKVLHIHPGIVPHVRGSDGLLWSIVTRGVPGVSCFYMDAGIDTGVLIGQKEFPCPLFHVRDLISKETEKDFYQALLISYDPHLRASLFRDIVEKYDGELSNIETSSANDEETESFLWMHPLMRLKAMSKVTTNEQR